MVDIGSDFVERNQLYPKLSQALKIGKVVYIGGHTGWGKTTAAIQWLNRNKKEYRYATADSETFFEDISRKEFKSAKWIVLDDLFLISDEDGHNTLVDYIAATEAKFILISRTELPAWLKPFYMTKQLTCFGPKDLAFSMDEMLEVLHGQGIEISHKEAIQLLRDCQGNPQVLMLAPRHLHSEGYSKAIYEKCKRDMFDCFDYALFQRWGSELQTFLMDISIVEQFNEKLVSMITGKHDAEKLLRETLSIGSFLKFLPPEDYIFEVPVFREYLLKKQKELLSGDHIRQLYQNAGLYYELNDDLINALKYYSLAGNAEKLSALLIENAKRHAGNAHFYDTEKYYFALSEEQIKQSPDLMSGMSMLFSLRCNTEESEKWYNALETFSKNVDKKDSRYKKAREKLLYLSIALPHRGSDDMINIVGAAATLCVTGKLSLQEMSVTGNLPSLLNGGKDFSEWTKIDKKLYCILKKPIEIVLGKCAVGLADTALGESLYSKCTDLNFTEALSYLNNGYSQAMLKGTMQMQFAVLGVMARAFVAQGSIDTAENLIVNFKIRVENDKEVTLLPNINALLTLFALYRGDYDALEDWMQQCAPNEMETFYILARFRYLVKIRAYLISGKYMEALSLLNLLKIYYERYGRPYGVMQSLLLRSIVLYRMKDESWRTELQNMLHQSEKYGFTRIVADEGMGVLEPLSKLDYDGDKTYYNTLLTLTRQQAVQYPAYLVPQKKMKEELTAPEKAVLRLIVQGMKNEDIANVLGVTVRTVKFHSGNIYAKLDVENRTQAVKAATENGLV